MKIIPKFIPLLVMLAFLSGCAMTTIQKPDGTTVNHSSLFVNTKNVDMKSTETSTKISIGNQIIDLEALKLLISILGAAQ
jgi:hypothetical protein